jgi:hypothetical protein
MVIERRVEYRREYEYTWVQADPDKGPMSNNIIDA